MKHLCLLAALALTACDALPKDSDGTFERVRAQHVFTVGVIAGSGRACPDKSRAFLAEVGRATGASPRIITGSAESMLNALRNGDLDLVVGELADDSPWATQASILEPLAAGCAGKVEYDAVGRNGENRWIMLLEEVGRTVRKGGGA